MIIKIGDNLVSVGAWRLVKLTCDIEEQFQKAQDKGKFNECFSVNKELSAKWVIERTLFNIIELQWHKSLKSDTPITCITDGGFAGEQKFSFTFKVWPADYSVNQIPVLFIYGFNFICDDI